ncbi:MAG: pyridoxamine 5'-phosphate oxidase family protein [Nitrospinae bacterium]|nr:pyridoxamine 5'-phosphate oxidase family protein [Nitrospinota bacterium]MBI3813023.1 pyridoxamine 5'-phosphate oxidase family protein [Nitrospinota bacterium]
MAKDYLELNEELINFIKAQKIFFVATAPNQLESGYINLSPKGYDTLKVLDSKTVVYADYPGSGNETATHIRQNGKLTMMFVSFDKDPMILRLYGNGEVVSLDSPAGKELKGKMEEKVSPHTRQLILLHIEKVKTSCGFGVPYYQYVGDRENLIEWCKKATLTGKIKEYMGFQVDKK